MNKTTCMYIHCLKCLSHKGLPNSDAIHKSYIHKYPNFDLNSSQRQTRPLKLSAVKICMMWFCFACVLQIEDLGLRAGKKSDTSLPP